MTPRGKKWMRNEELMTLVVEICCDTFKSVDEIAAVILRTPTYLKNKILPLLLAQERLERLYPTFQIIQTKLIEKNKSKIYDILLNHNPRI